MRVPELLEDQIAELYFQVAEMNRRGRNKARIGKVHEVDPAKGLARVMLREDDGTGNPYLSPWIRVREIAMGNVKAHIFPVVGEQVRVVSENGELSEAEIDQSVPYEDNPRPHDKAGEIRLTVNDESFSLLVDESGNITIDAPNFRLTADDIEINGPVQINGPKLNHNAKNVGDDHGHVTAPPGPVGPPV
jgi:phage baseplate assembly protein gpV